jgi:hypothetical protein
MLISIASYAMHIASAVFIVGLAGSSIVILISFFEDFVELFSKNEESETAPAPQQIGKRASDSVRSRLA